MGIPRKGGQCLAVVYSNIVAFNTRLFTRYVRRHPSEKINTKKVPRKTLQMPPRTIKHQLTCPFKLTSGSFLIGRGRTLVIPKNHLRLRDHQADVLPPELSQHIQNHPIAYL